MTLALCCGVTGNVIWGASYLFTRIAQQEAPPMVQMSLRFLLAFLLLNLMMLFGWEKIRLRGKNLRPLIVLSCVEPIYFFFESYGIYYSNSTFAGVTLAIVPVIAIGMGVLLSLIHIYQLHQRHHRAGRKDCCLYAGLSLFRHRPHLLDLSLIHI